ncbi:MAG: IS3 family transposase [Myxococcales bacterium]|nr:IS3 family transposase [Myxococcales bacterium]
MSRQTSRGLAPVATLCETFDVSRAAYYAAKARIDGRMPVPRTNVVRLPTRPKAASAEAVLVAIRKVIAEAPAWGVRKVWAVLRREHGLLVSRKRVWSIMRAAGLVLARDREAGEPPPRGHVVTDLPNRRFATDMTTVWTKREGWVAITPTIDCGCRSILGLVVSKSQDALTVLGSVREALVSAFGDPSEVPEGLELRTDHGSVYTGAECEELVRHWRLEHTYAPIGRTTGNSVVERVIRTMKEELLWLRDWNDAEEIRQAIEVWRRAYNERRPHQALDWKTPAEVRQAA